MRSLALLAPLALLAVACSAESVGTSTVPAPASPTSSVVTPTATVTTVPPGPGCLQGEPPFVESGDLRVDVPDGEVDAAHIASWSLAAEPECDRFTVDLATEGGAPARIAGDVSAFLIRDGGVLRILLDPAIASTAVIDQLFESNFLERVFTVRSLDGQVFIDLHLAGPAQGRVFVDRAPATITVDLMSGGDVVGSPAVSEFVVVLEPAETRASYPLDVAGYARTFEAEVMAQVATADQSTDSVLTTAADHSAMWGEFRLVIPEGPLGRAELFVGEPEGLGVNVPLVLN